MVRFEGEENGTRGGCLEDDEDEKQAKVVGGRFVFQ